MVSIAEKLLSKTEDNSIRWEETEEENTFQTSLPEYSFRIKKETYVKYTLLLFNQKATLLESISDSDIGHGYIIKDLYENARKKRFKY